MAPPPQVQSAELVAADAVAEDSPAQCCAGRAVHRVLEVADRAVCKGRLWWGVCAEARAAELLCERRLPTFCQSVPRSQVKSLTSRGWL